MGVGIKMGDRRQVHFEDMGLWYYTHWGGSSLPENLKGAITEAKPRWGDDSYCFRIILSQLIGEDWNSETGHGLNSHSMDSEYKDFIVNIKEQTVTIEGETQTFEEFIGGIAKEETKEIEKEDDEFVNEGLEEIREHEECIEGDEE